MESINLTCFKKNQMLPLEDNCYIRPDGVSFLKNVY